MKILDTSPISDSSQMPIKKGTLQFLQDANKEAFAAMMIGLIGSAYNPSNVYVINGVKNTGTGTNYVISAGAVFYMGEIFLVDSSSFTTSGTDVAVFDLSVSQYKNDADPVMFTDRSSHNVHNIRKVIVRADADGSGIGNYSSGLFLDFHIPKQLNATGAGVKGTYPDLVFAGPNGLFPILAAGRIHFGDISGGAGTKSILFATPLSNSNYIVIPSIVSIGTKPPDDISFYIGVIDSTRTVNGFTFQLRDSGPDVQNFDIAYIVIQLPS